MIVMSKHKLIYDGRIRRANAPFDAKDEDVELLVNAWGCQIVDEHKDTSLKKAKLEAKKYEIEPSNAFDVSKDVEHEKVAKKARKSTKKKG